MIIYNNNDWGPALDKDGNPPEETTPTYEDIMKKIHSGIVKALNHDGENAHICDNVE